MGTLAIIRSKTDEKPANSATNNFFKFGQKNRLQSIKMEKFCGKWLQISVTNADELMKAKGIGLLTRKAALLVTPTMEISLNESKTSVRFFSQTKIKTFDVTLPLDGSTFEMEADGNFVIKRQYKDGSGPVEVITRSL